MLSFSYDPATKVLEVTETAMSFFATKRSYWYYDTVNWRVSNFGKKNDVPAREMEPESIEWVKTYYFPKVPALAARRAEALATA